MTIQTSRRWAGLDVGRITRAALVGLLAGFLSGMFGVGGGILIVPALVFLLHFDQRLAHGTSLAAVLPIATSGLIAYVAEDHVDWPAALFLAIGAVAGALIGTHVLHLLPHRTLTIVFSVILLVTAARLVFDHATADGRATLDVGGALLLVGVGVAAGILAGLLGVGGGVILIPPMVMLFGIPTVVAKGTSLAVIIPTSVMGTWRNRANRNVDLPVALAVGLAGVLSSFPAAKVAARLDDDLSNTLFAILLVVIALRLLVQVARERSGGQPPPADQAGDAIAAD